MSRVITPPSPEGIEQASGFRVQVRALPEGKWQTVALYAACIDMHRPRNCAVALFDFEGSVEVRVETDTTWIYRVVVRPRSLNIQAQNDGRSITFTLTNPTDMMLEINDERYECLHLLAGSIEPVPMENVLWQHADRHGPNTLETRLLLARLVAMPQGRTLAFDPGFYVIQEYLLPIPSGTNIYLAPGTVILGGFLVENVENVNIFGHGIICQQGIHRFSSINGIRVTNSRKVSIAGITFLNPAHYTVYLGNCEDVVICGIRTFSCEGWSDGIDMMSCKRVHIDQCFLRTSDDCIAVYGSRWDSRGDTCDVLVENCILWADVAHPINIGTHGDYEHGGDTIEHLVFRNIDILEHHEPQPEYGGCMAVCAGDGNTVQDVLFENIRVEHIAQGRLLDVRIRRNLDYNPLPGNVVRQVTFRHIYCDCVPPMPSLIDGYDETRRAIDVRLMDVRVCGEKPEILSGTFTERITNLEDI